MLDELGAERLSLDAADEGGWAESGISIRDRMRRVRVRMASKDEDDVCLELKDGGDETRVDLRPEDGITVKDERGRPRTSIGASSGLSLQVSLQPATCCLLSAACWTPLCYLLPATLSPTPTRPRTCPPQDANGTFRFSADTVDENYTRVSVRVSASRSLLPTSYQSLPALAGARRARWRANAHRLRAMVMPEKPLQHDPGLGRLSDRKAIPLA